jgi:UDP-glucose 4-epimerase
MAMARKILITGGNGYVGREVTRLLYDHHEVCVADNLRGKHMRFREDELRKFRFERIDIKNGGEIFNFVSEFSPDTVIHLAAIHYIPECEADPAHTIQTNVVGTVNVLLACPANAHFVFASSGAVYKPDTQPHQELTAALEPEDVYGLSKLEAEHYVRYFARQRKLSAVVVRLFNVIGPGETNPHLMPEIVAQLKAGRTTIRLGNLWPKRDYIHVQDAALGFVTTALNHVVATGETLTVNLGTAQPYSVEAMIPRLRKIAGIDFSVEQDVCRVRKVDRPHLAADISRIQKLFGWKPTYTIDDALTDLWREPDLAAELIAKYQ